MCWGNRYRRFSWVGWDDKAETGRNLARGLHHMFDQHVLAFSLHSWIGHAHGRDTRSMPVEHRRAHARQTDQPLLLIKRIALRPDGGERRAQGVKGVDGMGRIFGERPGWAMVGQLLWWKVSEQRLAGRIGV